MTSLVCFRVSIYLLAPPCLTATSVGPGHQESLHSRHSGWRQMCPWCWEVGGWHLSSAPTISGIAWCCRVSTWIKKYKNSVKCLYSYCNVILRVNSKFIPIAVIKIPWIRYIIITDYNHRHLHNTQLLDAQSPLVNANTNFKHAIKMQPSRQGQIWDFSMGGFTPQNC